MSWEHCQVVHTYFYVNKTKCCYVRSWPPGLFTSICVKRPTFTSPGSTINLICRQGCHRWTIIYKSSLLTLLGFIKILASMDTRLLFGLGIKTGQAIWIGWPSMALIWPLLRLAKNKFGLELTKALAFRPILLRSTLQQRPFCHGTEWATYVVGPDL